MDYSQISNDIAIDFGSINTRIYIKGKGLVLDEASVIAFDNITGETITAGNEACAMLGRTPTSVSVIFPIQNGVICDCTLAEELLKTLLKRACEKTLIKPRIVMSVPCGITDVEKRALRDAAILAGARSVYLIDTPIAAAIGANCDVSLARGLMVADIGGGCCDIATISLGRVVSYKSYKTAGAAFTDALIMYLADKYSVSVGQVTAEECKKKVGSVFNEDKSKLETIKGMNLKTGLPTEITVTSTELQDVFAPIASGIANALKEAVDSIPQEILGDILEDGILLSGGGIALSGLVQKLKDDTELKLFPSPEKEFSVIRGLAACIENLEKMPREIFTVYHA